MKSTRFVRTCALIVAALVAALGATLSTVPAQAAVAPKTVPNQWEFTSGPWTVENSPGVWANSPTLASDTGAGLGNGDTVYLKCYYRGAAEGPYGNTVWYYATDGTNEGFINDHFLSTPGTAANPQFQTMHCNSAAYDYGYSTTTTFQVTGSPGVWDNSPTQADASGIGIDNGDTLELVCYYRGTAVGPYGNTLWYLAQDTVAHNAGGVSYGWINDHFLTTPDTAANPIFETQHC